jgi:hypothetical protein
MQSFKLFLTFFLLVFISNVLAQSDSLEVKKIILIDDSEFVGSVVSETDEIINFRTNAGVEIEIKKSLVKEIENISNEGLGKTKRRYRPGDHELFIMPTAYTMEDNQWYLSDYELFLLNFTYAASPNTHIGIFTLFPMTSDFLRTITLGVKQNYMRSEDFQAALWGTYTPEASGLSLGNVFSYGKGGSSFHIGLSGMTGLDDESDGWLFVYMVGGRVDLSRKICLMAEYTNASTAAENGFEGIITFGFRFIGESVSWELAGMRPLAGTGDADFFMAPLLKATVLFD